MFEFISNKLKTNLLFTFDSRLVKSDGRTKCVFLKNWPCQARITLVNINSNETIYYPFTISGNKFGRSCNTVEDPYGWICVLNKVKNMNLYKFNSMLHLNETRFSVQLELCEWKCRLNENVHIQNNNRIMIIVGRTEDN